MTVNGWLQLAIYFAVLTALVPLLGGYMARVYQGERLMLERPLGWLERLIYRVLGPSARTEQDWKSYGKTTIVFSFVFFLVLYLILRTQNIHPFNPEGFNSAPWDVTFNTTSSFITNTNWQYYGGETTMTYFSQMAGLAVQNFVSAAVGMAVLAAVIRGFASRGVKELGNFWRDVTRTLLYILLPLAAIGTLILVSQGVIQSLGGYVTIHGLGGLDQTLAMGPAASQIAIKQLGTNGGGFFNVNSAFPFENPTQFSNFVEVIFILLIPAAATAQFGRMVGNRRQGWALYATMVVFRSACSASPTPRSSTALPPSTSPARTPPSADGTTGGNLEGKEQRNGIAASAEWANVTTDASNGSVNSAHDSYTGIRRPRSPDQHDDRGGDLRRGRLGAVRHAVNGLTGGVHSRPNGRQNARVSREEGRVPRGEAGADRTALHPDGGADRHWDRDLEQVRDALDLQPGPQGFSETLYAYTSQANNNGSALAGYTGFVQPNAPGNAGSYGITFADILGGLSMLTARFVPLLSALAVAGSLSMKRIVPAGPGTFRTDTPTFVILLLAVIVIVAALTFFPAVLLGPVVQGLTNQLGFPT